MFIMIISKEFCQDSEISKALENVKYYSENQDIFNIIFNLLYLNFSNIKNFLNRLY